MGSTGHADIIKDSHRSLHVEPDYDGHDGHHDMPIIQKHVAKFSSASDSISTYINQRMGSAELASLKPLRHELMDVDDDAFFSYTGPEVSEGMVHLLDFDRREDAAMDFNALSAMSSKLHSDVSMYFGWSSAEDDPPASSSMLNVSNTLFGSRRLHASRQIIQDAKLAEEHAEGGKLFGSRRLAALSVVLQEGANRTIGAAAGASEMALDAAGAVGSAVGGAAGAVSEAVGGAVGGAAGARGGAAGAVSDAVGGAVEGAAGAMADAAGAAGAAAAGAAGAVGGAAAGVVGGAAGAAVAGASNLMPSQVKAKVPNGVVVLPKTPTPRVSVSQGRDGTKTTVRGATRAVALSNKLAAGSKVMKASAELPPDTTAVTAGMGGTQTLVSKKKKKADGNSVSQTMTMDADARVVYAVITDLMHYTVIHGTRSFGFGGLSYSVCALGL